MAKSKKQSLANKDKNLQAKLLAIPLIALLIKFIIIGNIQYHFWIGADGENYINALQGLLNDGVFSTEQLLSYWPAGYPLVMYVFGAVSRENTLVIMAILQSIFYALACFYFVKELAKTNLSKFAFWVAIILAINPTLSLSSMVIGYEIIPAAIFLFGLTFFLREINSGNKKIVSINSASAAALMSLSCFVQPRFLLTSVVFFLIWAFYTRLKKMIPLFLLINIAIASILPVALVARNVKANDFTAISTNLGITMNLGAGTGASGKYEPKGKYGVPCSTIEGNDAEKDSHLVNCVVTWYLKNPVEAIPLIARKAKHFWSPWIGPEGAGSMARNPLLLFHPIKSISANSVEGNNLVNGNFGKVVSWGWMLGGLILIGLGFRKLWNAAGVSRKLGVISLMIIVLNWAISVGTLGDHRQRLPIMTMSLFLQAIGFLSIFGKKWAIKKDA